MKYFIDADYLILRSSLRAETVVPFDDDLHVLFSHLSEAEALFSEEVSLLRRKLDAQDDEFIYCFSDASGRYFRHELFPDYKGHRIKNLVGVRKPIVYRPLLDKVMGEYDYIRHAGLEADDILGLNADQGVMVSPDKDLRTVPGKLYDPENPERGVVETTVESADLFHMTQTLEGDKSDGYRGCPGVGPVKAARILEEHVGDPVALWEATVQAYRERGHSYEDALVTARVAYILRPGDDLTDSPNFWNPPA